LLWNEEYALLPHRGRCQNSRKHLATIALSI